MKTVKQGKAVRLNDWQIAVLERLVDLELENEVLKRGLELKGDDLYRSSLRSLRNKLANL